MRILCYRSRLEGELARLWKDRKHHYCGYFDGGSQVFAGDLERLGAMLAEYAECDGDKTGFVLKGEVPNIPSPMGMVGGSNIRALPIRDLERLALIIKNKTPSKREVLIAT